MRHYFQAILPLKIDWNPWYWTEDDYRVGQRVKVRFSGREYVAVVYRFAPQPEIPLSKVHQASGPVEGLPDVSAEELRLWQFTADYYMCTLGEVFKAAYPLLKIQSEMPLKRGRKDAAAEDAGAAAAAEPSAAHKPAKPVLLVAGDRLPRYIAAIASTLAEGRSALVLVPENDFGANMVDALKKEFDVLEYNSLQGAPARRKLLSKVRGGNVVVLGARSSVFLPFKDLALVIVDEEQDASYKQPDPAPRYNGRDLACVLAGIHGSDLILGTSMPSLESLHNCRTGKFDLCDAREPSRCRIEIIDIAAERRKRGMKGDFSIKMIDSVRNSMESADCSLVTFIRCYETAESVSEQAAEHFPGLDPQIVSASAARKSPYRSSHTVVLQADLLLSKDDFRADEKALQLLAMLRDRCDVLTIQTASSSHPVFRALVNGELPDALLEERKAFNLPPYTRIIDFRTPEGRVEKREVIARGENLAQRKADLKLQYSSIYIPDVDPL